MSRVLMNRCLFLPLLLVLVMVLTIVAENAEVTQCGACQLITARLLWDFYESNDKKLSLEHSVCENPLVVGSVRDACHQVAPKFRQRIAAAALSSCYLTKDCSISSGAYMDDVSQRSALEQLFMVSGGLHSWKNRDGWLQSSRSICSWYGVRCSMVPSSSDGTKKNVVAELRLSANGLTGILPGALIASQLPQLKVLRIDNNHMWAIGMAWPQSADSFPDLEQCDLSGNVFMAPVPATAADFCRASGVDSKRSSAGGLSKRMSPAVLHSLGVNDSFLTNGGLTANDTFYNGSFPLHGGGDFSWGAIYAPIFTGDTNGSRDDDDNDNNNNNNNDDNNDNNNNNGIVVMGSNNSIEYENENININLNLNHNGNDNQNGNGANLNFTVNRNTGSDCGDLSFGNRSTTTSENGTKSTNVDISSTDSNQELAQQLRNQVKAAIEQLAANITTLANLLQNTTDNDDEKTMHVSKRGPNGVQVRYTSTTVEKQPLVNSNSKKKRDTSTPTEPPGEDTNSQGVVGQSNDTSDPSVTTSSQIPNDSTPPQDPTVPPPTQDPFEDNDSQGSTGQTNGPQFPEAPNEAGQYPDDGGVFNIDSIFGPIYSGLTNGPREDIDNDNNNNNNNDGNNDNNNNNQLYINGQNNRIKYKNRNVNFNFNDNWNDNENLNNNAKQKKAKK